MRLRAENVAAGSEVRIEGFSLKDLGVGVMVSWVVAGAVMRILNRVLKCTEGSTTRNAALHKITHI